MNKDSEIIQAKKYIVPPKKVIMTTIKKNSDTNRERFFNPKNYPRNEEKISKEKKV